MVVITRLAGVGLLGVAAHVDAVDGRMIEHTHPNHWELCFVTNASVHWCVGDEVYEVPPNSWYLTQPGEAHGSTSGVMEPCHLGWVQIADDGSSVLDLSAAESTWLRTRLRNMPRIVPAAAQWWDSWLALRQMMLNQTEPLYVSRCRNLLQQLIFAYLDDACADRPRALSPAIEAVVHHLHRHPCLDHSLSEMARIAGLGRSRFAERFKQETGCTPVHYHGRVKIWYAQRLLQDQTRSVLDVALEAGFGSSQYFAACFKRQTGRTPTQWRQTEGQLVT